MECAANPPGWTVYVRWSCRSPYRDYRDRVGRWGRNRKPGAWSRGRHVYIKLSKTDEAGAENSSPLHNSAAEQTLSKTCVCRLHVGVAGSFSPCSFLTMACKQALLTRAGSLEGRSDTGAGFCSFVPCHPVTTEASKYARACRLQTTPGRASVDSEARLETPCYRITRP
jgi:hypothetical protein